jgi:sugar transferase (PEP-CTERM/EpsH1 system associated)
MNAVPISPGGQQALVVHLLYRLDFGGLETLLVDCINRMPGYRHAVVCLAGYTAFADKITRPGVQIYSLDKAPGLGLGAHVRLFKLLRRLRPTILHTYNLSGIEYNFTAAMAGVPVRVHAEHGRDAGDPKGLNRKHKLLRKLLSPFVDRYVPVSGDLHNWLRDTVGIADAKNQWISNGVDTAHFHPGQPDPDTFVIGTVGRAQNVKNQGLLVDAFILLRAALPDLPMRLVIVGDGPLRAALERKVQEAGLGDAVWLPGARSDIAELMRTFSVFALSSLAEGTPVTLLEAMSCALPVVSTAVGGPTWCRKTSPACWCGTTTAPHWPKRWRYTRATPRWRATTAPPGVRASNIITASRPWCRHTPACTIRCASIN